MLFLGAIKNALVGGYQTLTLPSKIEKLERELQTELLAGLDGLKRFHAQEVLLLAELSSELEDLDEHDRAGQLRLMQLWINKMNAAIKEAEASLKREPANKLDVATLAVNIQDLALNTMREMEQHNAHVAGRLQGVEAKQRDLEQRSTQMAGHLQGMATRLKTFDQSVQELRDTSSAAAKLGTKLACGIGFVGLIALTALVLALVR